MVSKYIARKCMIDSEPNTEIEDMTKGDEKMKQTTPALCQRFDQ
jgi:hypothetical protein